MTVAERIQRKRTKGWRMPEGAVYVGRPTVFGNPFKAYKCDCCGYWDVKDDNDVTYFVDHQYVRQAAVRADRSTWTTMSDPMTIVHHIETKVDELSIEFSDYTPEARRRHEGKSLFVGLHVPREFTKHLTLSSVVTITITEKPVSWPATTTEERSGD